MSNLSNMNETNTNNQINTTGNITLNSYDRIGDVYTTTELARCYSNNSNYTSNYSTTNINKEMTILMNTTMKIKDVEIIIPNKVVKVTFDDNTFEKAVCHEDDVFNLETAITICIAKHLLGGSSKFNNILSKGIKIINNKIKAEEDAKKDQKRKEAKRLKNHLKRLAKKEKRLIDERNMRIKENAEAIVLAHEMMNTKPKEIKE